MYMLRAHTYLGDDPAACVNCHIMSPYYATWFHSSHARDATCNDCHVPHENIVKKWTFKGMDGMKHVAAFLTKSEPQVIQAHEASSQVIMNNCIRCHTQLNTEFVKTGKIDYMMSMVGEGKACWDCFGHSDKTGYFVRYVRIDSDCLFAYDSSRCGISEKPHFTDFVFCYLCSYQFCFFCYDVENSSPISFVVPLQSALFNCTSRTYGNRRECGKLGAACIPQYTCSYWDRDCLHSIVGIYLSETGGLMR